MNLFGKIKGYFAYDPCVGGPDDSLDYIRCVDCGRKVYGDKGDTDLRCRRCDVLNRRSERRKLVHQISPWQYDRVEMHNHNLRRLNRVMFRGVRGRPQVLAIMK
jgi:tRNA(Ile2) C34 agmatinyltransferase TiaS